MLQAAETDSVYALNHRTAGKNLTTGFTRKYK